LYRIEFDRFGIEKQILTFIEKGGRILACRTCLKLRKKESSGICPMSTMHNLFELVKEVDMYLLRSNRKGVLPAFCRIFNVVI